MKKQKKKNQKTNQNKEKKKLVQKIKEKIDIKQIKKYTKETIKNIILDNKLVFIYIFGTILNGILLRAFTIGNALSLRPVLADLVITIIFASFYFLIKKKYRFTYLIIITIISIIVCISNIVYYFDYINNILLICISKS